MKHKTTNVGPPAPRAPAHLPWAVAVCALWAACMSPDDATPADDAPVNLDDATSVEDVLDDGESTLDDGGEDPRGEPDLPRLDVGPELVPNPPPPPPWGTPWGTPIPHFTAESGLRDLVDGPHPAMPDIDCDDVDAVVAQCEDDIGVPGAASCRLETDATGAIVCENAIACAIGVPLEESAALRARYAACTHVIMHVECGRAILARSVDERWEFDYTRAGGFYVFEHTTWSDERRQAWTDVFRTRSPAIYNLRLGGLWCRPDAERTSCLCSLEADERDRVHR